jgi:hypothetical protein
MPGSGNRVEFEWREPALRFARSRSIDGGRAIFEGLRFENYAALEEREGSALPVEEVDDEGRFERAFPGATAGRLDGLGGGCLETEEGFGGRGAIESLMRPEGHVIGERGF